MENITNKDNADIKEQDLRYYLSLEERQVQALEKLIGRAASLHELIVFSSLTSKDYSGIDLHNLTRQFVTNNTEHFSYRANRHKSYKLKNGKYLNVARRTLITDYSKESASESFFYIYKELNNDLSRLGTSPLTIGVNTCSDVYYNSQMQVIFSDLLHEFVAKVNMCSCEVDTFSFSFDEEYTRKQFFDFFAFGLASQNLLDTNTEAKDLKLRLLYVGDLPQVDKTWRQTSGLVQGASDDKRTVSPINWSVDDTDPVHPFYIHSINSCFQILQEKKLCYHISPVTKGGLASAAFDLSLSLQKGVSINLLKFVEDDQNFGTEVESSSSASGLLLCTPSVGHIIAVDPDNIRDVQRVLKTWDVPYVSIGNTTEEMDLVFKWTNSNVVNLPTNYLKPLLHYKEYEVLDNPPMLKDEVGSTNAYEKFKNISGENIISDEWVNLLGCADLLPISSLDNQYDTTIRPSSIFRYSASKAYCDGEDALVYHGASRNSAFRDDPYMGVSLSVSDLVSASACLGALPEVLFPSLVAGNLEDHRSVSDVIETTRALEDLSKLWSMEVVDLNISTNRDLAWRHAGYFSIFSVGQSKTSNILSGNFKDRGDAVMVVGEDDFDILNSKYYQYCYGAKIGARANLNFDAQLENAKSIIELVATGVLKSCMPVSDGGIAVAVSKACLLGEIPLGVSLEVEECISNLPLKEILFGDVFGTYLISFPKSQLSNLRTFFSERGMKSLLVGDIGYAHMQINAKDESVSIPLTTAYNVWHQRVVV